MKHLKSGRSLIAVIMSVIVLLTSTPAYAADDANDGYYNIITGQYDSARFDEGETRTFYYSDEYFREPGSHKNVHLRSMSAALSLSTMQENSDEYVIDVLEKIGYKDIKTYKNEVRVTLAHKIIDEKEIVVFAIRGDRYTKEWASNFKAGESGDAEGFLESAMELKDDYDKYKQEVSINPEKIWVTGYSRGGAVADLFGKYLNENAQSLNLNVDDIYVYTFEAPMSTLEDVSYANIHNCVDENDFITYVYPANWGFGNCGVKEVINAGNTRLMKKSLDLNGLISGSEVIVKNDGKTTYAGFINGFVNWLSDDKYLSREAYVNYFQDFLGELVEVVFDKDINELKKMLQYFKTDFIDSLTTDYNKLQLLLALSYMDDPKPSSQEMGKKTLKNMIYTTLDKKEAKNIFSAEEIELLKKAFGNIVDACLLAVADDFDLNSFIYSFSVSDELYTKTESTYVSDKNNNALDKFGEDKKDIWYEGFEAGYDAGYSAGEKRTSYDSTPENESSNDAAYISGYKYGYYESYLLGVGKEILPHTLERIVTIAMNIENFLSFHYPEENIKLIEKLDSYYTNEPSTGSLETGSVFSKGNPLTLIIILLTAVLIVETIILLKRRKK